MGPYVTGAEFSQFFTWSMQLCIVKLTLANLQCIPASVTSRGFVHWNGITCITISS